MKAWIPHIGQRGAPQDGTFSIFEQCAMLSYMRYYITMKTQNTEAIDEKWLRKIIILAYLGKYQFVEPP